jgi:ankyrin repeat protein
MRPCTPLCLAAKTDAIDVADLLCAAGAAVDPLEEHGWPLEYSPLAVAAEHGQFAMVRFLVAKGAKLDAYRGNPLYSALASGHYDIAAFLIEAGANFDAKPCGGWNRPGESRPPFAFVCELIETGRDKAQAQALALLMIERGLDANAGANDRRFGLKDFPIYAAIASGDPQVVSALIAAGADVSTQAGVGRQPFQRLMNDGEVHELTTPLELATACGCPEIVALISDAL